MCLEMGVKPHRNTSSGCLSQDVSAEVDGSVMGGSAGNYGISLGMLMLLALLRSVLCLSLSCRSSRSCKHAGRVAQ